MSRATRALLAVAFSASVLQCSSREHPPALVSSEAGGGATNLDGTGGGLAVGEAGADAAFCGNQRIPAVTAPPNVYFIIDRSGSMGDPLPGSSFSKYENARVAISVMLRAVGHRIRYGAGVFPAFANEDGCAPGLEIFPTSPGDPPSYAANHQNGPTLEDLLTRLGSNAPSGGTPTAASLEALKPTIFGLKGPKTYVVLMTDGAPNCNIDLRCTTDSCIPNIEQLSRPQGGECDSTFNCCAPKAFGGGQCVDADATEAAVAEYEANGIDTYVVGMPGSEAYRSVLSRLAHAGNTARSGNTPYYAVSDTDQLSLALRSIGAQVAITCDLPLAMAPEDPSLVNVYFDQRAIPKDDQDGWRYSSESSLQFRGSACADLSSGDVLNVQVLSGCPTLLR